MAQTPQPPEHLERLRVNLENFIKRAITKEVFSNSESNEIFLTSRSL